MSRRLLSGALAAAVLTTPVFATVPDVRPARITLSLALDDRCAMPEATFGVAKEEATRVWSAAGVALRWTTMAALPYRAPQAQWLLVRCTEAAPGAVRGEAGRLLTVAAIRFIGALPTNTMVVNLGHAAFLLKRDTLEARELDNRFRSLRERRLGRMVGRAIAHEIGHFLTQSGAHTETGLMRASHSVAAFTGESVAPFGVDGLTVAAPVLEVAETEPHDPR